jgi:hypothetical protein
MIKPTINLQELRAKLGHRAKSVPTHRFWGLHVHVVKLDTLEAAYLEAKRNNGAPGSDGETFELIEARGRDDFLRDLAADLRAGTYRPRPYRRREIPKEGGKVRVISIRDPRPRGARRPPSDFGTDLRSRLLGQLLRSAPGTISPRGDRESANGPAPPQAPCR